MLRMQSLVLHRSFEWRRSGQGFSAEEDVFHQRSDDQHEHDQDNDPPDTHAPHSAVHHVVHHLEKSLYWFVGKRVVLRGLIDRRPFTSHNYSKFSAARYGPNGAVAS